MEQKKILWIVIAVSVFVLIIFGTAIILYSPARGVEASLQQAAAVTPAKTVAAVDSATTIDPDSWVRDKEINPESNSPISNATGSINLTIVNGDNAQATYGEFDVTGLTRPSGRTELTKNDLAPENIPGQVARESTADVKDTDQKVKPVQTTRVSEATKQVSPKEPARSKPVQPAVKKPAPVKKTVIVTDYWIQAGSYANKLNAERARTTLADRYLNAEIFTRAIGGADAYRVRVGPYNSKAEADYWLGTVKGIPEFSDSYVSQVKTKK
ncbi:MAG TPA: hypothetical protein GXZ47_05070 [Treponema sp.]|nr:hypothetical protein [Treponema sp.]